MEVGTPCTREVTRNGHPIYHVNVIKLKREIYGQAVYPTQEGYLTCLGSLTSLLIGPYCRTSESLLNTLILVPERMVPFTPK